MAKYLRVMYKTGDTAAPTSTIISGPFTQLVRVAAFVRRVMQGAEPLAFWRAVEGVHPVTGAPATMRERQFINGREVVTVEEVSWQGDDAPLLTQPSDLRWKSVAKVARGAAGLLRVRSPELADLIGVPRGTELPLEYQTLGGTERQRVALLNADGSRLYNVETNAVWESGVRQGVVLDEEDAAADGIAVAAMTDEIVGAGHEDEEELEERA